MSVTSVIYYGIVAVVAIFVGSIVLGSYNKRIRGK